LWTIKWMHPIVGLFDSKLTRHWHWSAALSGKRVWAWWGSGRGGSSTSTLEVRGLQNGVCHRENFLCYVYKYAVSKFSFQVSILHSPKISFGGSSLPSPIEPPLGSACRVSALMTSTVVTVICDDGVLKVAADAAWRSASCRAAIWSAAATRSTCTGTRTTTSTASTSVTAARPPRSCTSNASAEWAADTNDCYAVKNIRISADFAARARFAMWARCSSFRRFTDTNVSLCGTGFVKMRKTRHQISRIYGYFLQCAEDWTETVYRLSTVAPSSAVVALRVQW